MTDSPRLGEVFAAVLAEHRLDDHECDCGYLFNTTFTDDEVFALHAAHQAERLAARFLQVGVCESEPMMSGERLRFTSHVRAARPDRPEFPVFRLLGGDR